MNQPSSTCDQSKIAGFLAGTISDQQQTLLESHLETCEDCRRALEESASETSVWNAAGNHLRDDDHDRNLSAVVPVSNAPGHAAEMGRIQEAIEIRSTDSASAVVIRQIIGWLDPTDDSRMLGRIGTYEIAGVIGAGGMGVVLKGFDGALNRYVAIKLLAPHLAGNGASRQRFAREAQAAAAVVHESVIAIHSVSEFNDLPYLVMPYVKGQSLQKRIDTNGPISVAEVLRIGMQTASGLAAAHAQGLVHRDIKPANILLTDGISRVAITDFGLARAADDASLTHSGAIAGTPQYMSPEQASGQPVDHRSDLFSLGSVMYAMFAGRPPFRAESAYGILKRIAEESARPLQDVNVDVPGWLVGVIEQLHAREPNRRFQTATEVEMVLSECLAHVQQPSRVELPAAVAKLTPRRTPKQRWWWPAVGLAIALVAMVCWWQFSDPSSVLISEPTTPVQFTDMDVPMESEFKPDAGAFDGAGPQPYMQPDEKFGTDDGSSIVLNKPGSNTPVSEDSFFGSGFSEPSFDEPVFYEPSPSVADNVDGQSIQNEIDMIDREFMELESRLGIETPLEASPKELP